MGGALGERIRYGKTGGTDGVAELPPACCAAPRVAGDGVCGLAVFEIDCDCDDALRLDFEVQGIGHDKSAIRYRDGLTTRKGDLLHRIRLNLMDASSVVLRKCNRYGGNGQVGNPKCIRYLQADLRCTNRHLQGLAYCRIDKHHASLVLRQRLAIDT